MKNLSARKQHKQESKSHAQESFFPPARLKRFTGIYLPVSPETLSQNPSSPCSGTNFPLQGLQTTPPNNRNVIERFPQINIAANIPLNSSGFNQGVLKAPTFVPNSPAYPTGFKRSQRALIKFDRHPHILPVGDIRPSALPCRGGRNICRATTQRFFRKSLDVNSSISHDISMLTPGKTGFYIYPPMDTPISPERIPFHPPHLLPGKCGGNQSFVYNYFNEQKEHTNERIDKQTHRYQTQGTSAT
jgi:hypothetical protein